MFTLLMTTCESILPESIRFRDPPAQTGNAVFAQHLGRGNARVSVWYEVFVTLSWYYSCVLCTPGQGRVRDLLSPLTSQSPAGEGFTIDNKPIRVLVKHR